jgi:hypothetical protein
VSWARRTSFVAGRDAFCPTLEIARVDRHLPISRRRRGGAELLQRSPGP